MFLIKQYMHIQIYKLTAYESNSLSAENTGLGNVLFQIASLYGMGKKLNRTISYDSLRLFSKKLKDNFNYNHGESIYRKFLEYPYSIDDFNNIIYEKMPRQYDTDIFEQIAYTNDSVKICGHFEYPGYFHEYREDILNLLSIDDTSLSYIKNKYPILFDSSMQTISVHFRFGDFGKDLYLTYEYYMRAIENIIERVSNPILFVFSDEIEKTKEYFNGITTPIIFVENNPDYIDLWLMSLCKHNITCRSTFSWWGAYLNKNADKIVIYKEGKPGIYNFIENSVCF
jgi:hypothetical protein